MDNSKMPEKLSDFINDLNKEKKPGAYDSPVDEESEKLFETVRAVKRTQRSQEVQWEKLAGNLDENDTRKTQKEVKPKRTHQSFVRKISLVAVAAALILAAFVGIMDTGPLQEGNIVHAVVRAYQDMEGYSGVVELTSQENGKIDFKETINITYQKPWKYAAVHQFNDVEVKNISDGERLVSVYPNDVTVDNVFPEKELWRYHIGTHVWELGKADEVKEKGTEMILGRETTVLEYSYSDYYHRMWIDKETNLPLKKELKTYDDRSLVMEFKEIEINPEVDKDIFEYDVAMPEIREEADLETDKEEKDDMTMMMEPEPEEPEEPQEPGEQDRRYEEINRQGELEDIRTPVDLDLLLASIPSSYELFTVGMLDRDIFFDHVLRFKGANEMEFLDIYLSSTTREFDYFSDSRVGKLEDGYVEVNKRAVNVLELYTGESSIAQWITPEFEIFIAANQGSDLPAYLLEEIADEDIKYKTFSELKEEGIDLPVEKEGH